MPQLDPLRSFFERCVGRAAQDSHDLGVVGEVPALRSQLDELEQDGAHLPGVGAQLDEHAVARRVRLAQQPEQQVLGADVVVAEAHRLAQAALENPLGTGGEGDLAVGVLGARVNRDDGAARLVEPQPGGLQRLRGEPLVLADEAEQEVLGPDAAVVQAAGLLLGQRDDLARALGEALEHQRVPAWRSNMAEGPTRCERRSKTPGATACSASIGRMGAPLTVTSGRSRRIALRTAATTRSGFASPASSGARSFIRSHIPVAAMKPGETTLKPTGASRNSARSERVTPISPALVAAYGSLHDTPTLPDIEAMNTTCPRPRASIPRSRSRARSIGATRLIATIW